VIWRKSTVLHVDAVFKLESMSGQGSHSLQYLHLGS